MAVWSVAGFVLLIMPVLVALIANWQRTWGAESKAAVVDSVLGPTWAPRFWRGLAVYVVGVVVLLVAVRV